MMKKPPIQLFPLQCRDPISSLPQSQVFFFKKYTKEEKKNFYKADRSLKWTLLVGANGVRFKEVEELRFCWLRCFLKIVNDRLLYCDATY